MGLLLVLALFADDPASEPASASAASEPAQIMVAPPVEEAVAPEEPASAPVTAATPAPPAVAPKKATVTAAVNADQAALSGASVKPWSVNLTFNTSLGIGTFLAAQTSQAAYVGSSLTIEPGYVLSLPKGFRVRLSARETFSLEYTPPDEPTGRRFDWSDLLIGGSARMYKIPVIDVDLWASFRMPIPISMDSIQASLVTAIVTGTGASKNFEWGVPGGGRMSLNVRYDFVLRKNFNRFNVPVYRATDNPYAPTLHTRATDSLVDGGIGRGAANTNVSISNGFTVSFTPIDWLSISVFASIANVFRYEITAEPDQYTPAYAYAGAGRADMVRTNIDLTFTVHPKVLLSTGVFSAAPPLGPDNKTPYPPFIVPSAAANNFTQLYLSMTALL